VVAVAVSGVSVARTANAVMWRALWRNGALAVDARSEQVANLPLDPESVVDDAHVVPGFAFDTEGACANDARRVRQDRRQASRISALKPDADLIGQTPP
jgi:hypothetical protein